MSIKIYTDGSCHTQLLIGAWAAIVFIADERILLKGVETGTTHNRMELLAAIEAIKFIDSKGLGNESLHIFSDSQYLVNLISRQKKLEANHFNTNKGTPIQNIDLVKIVLKQIACHDVKLVKVKAHEKPDGTENFNREVDLVVRKLVRENVKEND